MDIYEGIHSDIVSSNRFNENSDISTAYRNRKQGESRQIKSRGIISYIRKWLHLG